MNESVDTGQLRVQWRHESDARTDVTDTAVWWHFTVASAVLISLIVYWMPQSP